MKRSTITKRVIALGLTVLMVMSGAVGVLAEEEVLSAEPSETEVSVPEPASWTLSGGKLTVNRQEALEDYAYGTAPWFTADPAVIKEKVLLKAESELGYHEKASGSQLYEKNGNNGDKNYTKFTYELKYTEGAPYIYYPSEWCDAFVDWCMWSTYGSKKAQELICGPFNGYTPSSSSYYKNKKQWYTTPQVGDQVFFQGSTRINHTGLVIAVTEDRIYTLEGNANNRVRKRSYLKTDGYIAGYGRPNYDALSVQNTADSITSVQVAEAVTRIGDWAFSYCSALTSASLPSTLEEIGDYAFYHDTALARVNLPSGLKSIGNAAFQEAALQEVTIPETVTSIGNSAFFGCKNIVEMVVPEGVEFLEEYTFMGCENLREVVLPSTLKSLQLSALGACDKLVSLVYRGTQENWESVQKLAGDNTGGKYDLKAAVHYGDAQRVSGYWDVYTDDWYAADVTYVKDHGLMNGTEDGIFEPGTGATRGTIVTILYRLAGSPVVAVAASGDVVSMEAGEVAQDPSAQAPQDDKDQTDVILSEAKDLENDTSAQASQDDSAQDDSTQEDVILSEAKDLDDTAVTASEEAPTFASERTAPAFTDVPSDAWYASAVKWAYENGIVSGYDEEHFGPNDPITRQQFAAILYRYARSSGTAGTADPATVDLRNYTDAAAIDEYALEAMQWVNAAGILMGTSETTLEPAGNTNRGQIAAILHRFCEM